MRYVDPHVHGETSACSAIRDVVLLDFFEQRPEYTPVVTDHGRVDFYARNAEDLSRLGSDRLLYGAEISIGYYNDFVLLSYTLEPFLKALPVKSTRRDKAPFGLMRDERVLVTWAHPHQGGMPKWIRDVPVDFVELNAMRLTWQSGGRWVWRFYHDLAVVESHGVIGRRDDDGAFHPPRWIVGSDAHEPDALGETRVEFADEVSTGREAWELLRTGRFSNRLALWEGPWATVKHFGSHWTQRPWEQVKGWE